MANLSIEAGLYWPNEAPQVSLRRMCHLLIQQGMTTENYGEFVAPNDALLRALEQPDTDVHAVGFITSSKKRPVMNQTRRPPGKLVVSYGYLSHEAAERGDHPSIQVAWDGTRFWWPDDALPRDAPVKGLQAYHFFTQLCTELDPLYAALELEGSVPCLYDVLHPALSKSHSHLPMSEFYCRQGILAESEETFWRTYAYHEPLPRGVYGSDYRLFNPRRRSLGGTPKQQRQIHAERRILLVRALKRFGRLT